jgi:hypothetical protein
LKVISNREELAADRWANLISQKLLVCVSVTFVTADDSGLSNQIAKEQTTNRICLFFPRPFDFRLREERDRETDVSAAARDHLSGSLRGVNAPD